MESVAEELLEELMSYLRDAAVEEILPRFRSVSSDSKRAKTSFDDIVTDADIASEHLIAEKLRTRLPDIVIIGEEAVSEDPSLLDRLSGADLAAVIDPLDGTWHFAHGSPMFGSILAIVSRGRTIAGIIHYPVLGDFLIARPGGGAWHVGADGASTRLAVAEAGSVNEMQGFAAVHAFEAQTRASVALGVLNFSRVTSWRCSAWEYRMLATGAMSFCLNEGMNPWDHAAGILIHAEAGGYAATTTGQPYRPAVAKGHLLAAPDSQSWKAILEALSYR